MAEDTLTLAPDTSPVETEAPEVLDTAEVDTESEDTGEETADTRDFDAELEAAREEARKAALAEVEEQNSIKELRARVAQSHNWLSRTGAEEISSIVRYFVDEVDSGRKTAAQALAELKPENIERGPAARMASAVITSQLAAMDDLQDGFLKSDYPEWRIPPELVKRKEMALARLDTVEMFNVRKEILRRAILENDVPKEAQKLTEARAQQNQKAANNAAVKGSDAAKANAPRPTNVTGGSPASTRLSLAQIEAMPTAEWLAKPREERNRLLEQARRG